jgi:desulfoferrodoxin (superoxide reductase-like protein)
MRPGVPAGAADAGDGGASDAADAGARDAAPATVEHFIGRLYIKNQDGVVVGWKSFTASDREAQVLFALPLGTTKVTAFAWCNLHNVWKSATFDVACS